MRADGAVGARQARREAARVEVADRIPGLSSAVTSGQLSGEHVDAIARHAAALDEEQHSSVAFGTLIAKAKNLPPETLGGWSSEPLSG